MVIDVLDPVLELDQAAIDAEFVAIVLLEAPWGVSEAAPAPMPGRTATATRTAPWRPRTHRDRSAGRSVRPGGVREPGRRPRSVARSPPPARSIDRRH